MRKSNKIFGQKTKKELNYKTFQAVSNRYLCPSCNYILAKQGLSLSPTICPNCGRLMTRITFYSH
jgi:rubrerythrin